MVDTKVEENTKEEEMEEDTEAEEKTEVANMEVEVSLKDLEYMKEELASQHNFCQTISKLHWEIWEEKFTSINLSSTQSLDLAFRNHQSLKMLSQT